ncbi:MAG: hypothetical protein A3I44_05190 [Candidatus Sungbacteria bacterium RIFCSPLOWO2_02_FULL_51_17]|uniref:Type-4 uracil-DNA glycosylase n=1 Tax=Candidatus Sungbacteria bacterium RIFCSPHIGHO2_02_FULL_51_29 TaxID=1802273 RepID=A0A1G2KRF5_9BACT|nr:MAG: hypothetical protein A2676_00625 [Candidatus Sungbacteria bacterium RIFCSPHIGHO2_01_FULL_51_22]OHA01162.1 MAG: hypothetical protein A3C16_04560 [Candidatus Sungbacteria bacterium RIFCSPHIGHO2_02_FULL_51_29]OHA08054.1 MAG: hypothetical protein A3B29_03850 [Candidatus Sungbacteria bacterium RIFCSPLOWO2_01_FULL_51_34]OHA11466.1 MAG: hypothetical protein A3I44_05190 [Candidatus Sungbacteria bacterium RIFCSPLOWO2_02_FULL_51_17]
MIEDNRTELLRQIKDEVINLKTSPLYAERMRNKAHCVIGEGSHCASIMFVGEAPGRNEALTGRPFAGAAGRVLDEMLATVGIVRKDVYITNIVKDRPTNNRDPLPEEIACYAPFLDRQIEIIQPKIIVMLGRYSMKYLLEKFGLGAELTTITRMHGKLFMAQASYGTLTLMPIYHPAATLYNPNLKKDLAKDFELLKGFI